MAFSGKYTELEDAIVAQLQPLVSAGIEVVRTPDTEEEHTDAFEYTRVSVMYISSEYSNQPIKGYPILHATNSVFQTEYATVSLNIQGRKLRTSKGVHAVKEDLETLLLGFRPNQVWDRLASKNYSYVENKEGVWYFMLTMVCARPLIQDSIDLPLINSDNAGLIENGQETVLAEIVLNVNC